MSKKDGKVLRAKVQTRIVAWVNDTRKKEELISNGEKDQDMLVITSHIVEMELE